MFDAETPQMKEDRRSRMYLILGGIGALALAFTIVVLASKFRQPPNLPLGSALPGGQQLRLPDAQRKGNPEFDTYRPKITIEDVEKRAAQNAMGMTQMLLTGKLTNKGDRTLSGLELEIKAMSYAEPGKVLAINTSTPIPRLRKEPLKAGESMKITMKLDLPSTITEDDVADIVPEVSALIFQ
jgi:hypothetical protein